MPDPIAPAPVIAAPVAQPPAPALVAQPIVPEERPRSNWVPPHRVREINDRANQYRLQAETATQALTVLQERFDASAGDAEAALTKHRTLSGHKLAMARMSSERPALAHASIQEFLISGYTTAVAGQEEPPAFDAWLTAVEEANDPLYSPHLKRAAGPDPRVAQMSTLLTAMDAGTMTPEQAAEAFIAGMADGGGTQPAAITPAQQIAILLQQMAGNTAGGAAPQVLTGDPNAGTRPVQVPAKSYTLADITRLKSQNGGRLPRNVRDAMEANMKQSGSIK